MIRFAETFQNKTKLISRRMFILSSLKLVVFVSIISRLFYLQISENIKWSSLSDKNRLREWKIIPQRGIIEDYFGKEIAKNTQVFQLHMFPEDVPNINELFFKLSKIINFTEDKKRSLIKRLKKRKPWEPIIVSDNLTWEEFSRLNLFLHETQGIKPIVSVARQYLNEGSSSHLVGYVSDTSVKDLENSELLREINTPGLKTGKSGLEKLLNNEIIGDQKNKVNVYEDDLRDIYNSRTFCLFEDIELIKKNGLAKGGSLENAIVVKGKEILNPEGLRNEKEFVNHKILDCIGDLYTSGYRMIGSVICSRGGHYLTNQLLRKVFDNKENFSILEIKEKNLPHTLINNKLLRSIA